MAHKFSPEKIHKLDDPERRSWQDPDFILERIGLTDGMVFADIGCGSGWFVVAASGIVGVNGWVHAIDLQAEMLEVVNRKIQVHGLENVTLHLCDETQFHMNDAMADMALLANVYHELECREDFLREIGRILKPGGRLAILEWKKEELPKGPPPEEKVSEDEVESALAASGFNVVDMFYPGPYHVCMVGEKVL